MAWRTIASVIGVGFALGAGWTASAQTTRVSVGPGGAQSDNDSLVRSVSADGRFVAFESQATNLVAGDTNGTRDIFVHDRQTGVTSRISVGPGGAQATGISSNPSISADGRYVAFESTAGNLIAGDTNGVADVFVHDRQTGSTVRVSVSTAGFQSVTPSVAPVISGNGRFVAFRSGSTNLVPDDTNGAEDIFVHDRDADGDGVFDEPGAVATTRVSVSTAGVQANASSSNIAISHDGRYVSFRSSSTNLVESDTNGSDDIFLHDRQTGTTTRVSVGTGGTQANFGATNAAMSSDGRYIVFESIATNIVAGDTNGVRDIFLHDRQNNTTTRVSVTNVGGQATGQSGNPSISANGRKIAFESSAANLVTGDTNAQSDVFVRDLDAGTTTRIGLGPSDVQGNGASTRAVMSGDGRFVAFESLATNLVAGDTNGRRDVFVFGEASCPADLTGDGLVNASDLAQMLGVWGVNSGPADITGDGLVNASDLAQMLGVWGACN